jgi:hypothetical protein
VDIFYEEGRKTGERQRMEARKEDNFGSSSPLRRSSLFLSYLPAFLINPS